jgi:DNA-binding transcriptional LysR family regulator
MDDLNAMAAFAKVVQHGGFSRAARALGVQVSLLSRQVAELERQLGVRLLNRTTRRMSLTDVGQTYYLHCAALVAEAEAAKEAIERTRSAPHGTVRISCPIPLLESDVAAILSRFLATWPDVRVHVEATGRRVDPIDEGIDIALRVRPPPLEDSGLVVRPLAYGTGQLVASPVLLARHTTPRVPEDLAALPTVDVTRPGDKHTWQITAPDGTVQIVTHHPRLVVDDFPTLRRAVQDGIGVALLPSFLVRSRITQGALVPLLPDYELPVGLVHAVFPSRRGLVPAVRLLIDALVEGFSSNESRDERVDREPTPSAGDLPFTGRPCPEPPPGQPSLPASTDAATSALSQPTERPSEALSRPAERHVKGRRPSRG